MRVLVIPDIHLKPWIFDRTEKILRDGKADRAVCLMDMPDDWNMEFQIERYKETFDRAIAFAEDYPDTLWCYGNHDVSYSWGRLETGYSPYAERTVMLKLEELENRLKSPVQINIMHRIDNVLFSHGGLTADFLILLLTGSNNLLHLAVFCQDGRLSAHFANTRQSLQNRAYRGKTRRNKTMIKILFICHGSI